MTKYKTGVLKTSKSTTRRKPRWTDSIPEHIGSAFERELEALVDNLCSTYNDPKSRYLREHLFSKYLDEGKVPASTRAQAAVEKWLSCERNNNRTNQRLYLADEDKSFGWPNSGLIRQKAAQIVREVLGPIDIESLLCLRPHTNGASTRVRRGPMAAIHKLIGEAHVSESALPHWERAVKDTVLDSQTVKLVNSSQMFTVPKKSDIDRVACKEPELNLILQRCVGRFIRNRLKIRGIDLRDQRKNQSLAKAALSRGLATVDLSAASDSITWKFVFDMVPFELYSLMDDLRVKSTLLPDGTLHSLEMFSSMGNGFTFELESLLFYALTCAVNWSLGLKGTVSVYGDDIITSKEGFKPLRNVFGFVGFTINTDKSFYTGLYRESCGKHYFDGQDISPFFIREPVRKLSSLIRALNQLLKWDSIDEYHGFWTEEVARFHKKWANHVPSSLRGGDDVEVSEYLVYPGNRTARIDLTPPLFRRVGNEVIRVEMTSAETDDGRLKLWLLSTHDREPYPLAGTSQSIEKGSRVPQKILGLFERANPCEETEVYMTRSPTIKRDKYPEAGPEIYWVLTQVTGPINDS